MELSHGGGLFITARLSRDNYIRTNHFIYPVKSGLLCIHTLYPVYFDYSTVDLFWAAECFVFPHCSNSFGVMTLWRSTAGCHGGAMSGMRPPSVTGPTKGRLGWYVIWVYDLLLVELRSGGGHSSLREVRGWYGTLALHDDFGLRTTSVFHLPALRFRELSE